MHHIAAAERFLGAASLRRDLDASSIKWSPGQAESTEKVGIGRR